ncbi:MAG: hypothetical protein QME07_00275, partial [bacterium]|nr:hypothetical protein [bacterium]
EAVKGNNFFDFNYGKKSGLHYGILLDFEVLNQVFGYLYFCAKSFTSLLTIFFQRGKSQTLMGNNYLYYLHTAWLLNNEHIVGSSSC